MLHLRQADSGQMGNIQTKGESRRQTNQGTGRARDPTILLSKNAHNSRRNNRRVSKVSPSLRQEASRDHIDEEPCWKAKTSRIGKRYREQKTSSSLSKSSWLRAST